MHTEFRAICSFRYSLWVSEHIHPSNKGAIFKVTDVVNTKLVFVTILISLARWQHGLNSD